MTAIDHGVEQLDVFHRDVAVGLGVVDYIRADALVGSVGMNSLSPIIDATPPIVDARGYSYVRPLGVNAEIYNSAGYALFSALESAGIIQAEEGDIEDAYMIQYQQGAELLPHVDTTFSDTKLIRITKVLRGSGVLWSHVTGEVDFSAGALMVQDLSRPVLHGATALTDRWIAAWDIPGSVVRR